MIKIDMSDLDSITDDFIELVDADIIDSAESSASYAVSVSPVLSGMFKANWNASIDKEYDGLVSTSGDSSGAAVMSSISSELGTFSLKKDSVIFIQNNVSNEDEHYAATVSFDQKQITADRIISRAAAVAAEKLN